MDPNVGAFLEVVHCRPEEVRDIPAGRLQLGCVNPSREERRNSLGETQIYFGKHAGQRLKDVPREYLAWALDQKPTTKTFASFSGRCGSIWGSPSRSGGVGRAGDE